jgi:hypothetical protein
MPGDSTPGPSREILSAVAVEALAAGNFNKQSSTKRNLSRQIIKIFLVFQSGLSILLIHFWGIRSAAVA